MAENEKDRLWESGYDGHERAQRLRLAKLPLFEKLSWLEEAQKLVINLKARKKAD